MSDLFSAIVGALIGAIIGGLITLHSSRRSIRSAHTSTMHGEYFKFEMQKVQQAAWGEIPNTLGVTISELANDQSSEDGIVNILVVMRFYQRLSLMVMHDEVDRAVIPELFGNDFVLWYYSLYQWWLHEAGNKRGVWSSGEQIKWLYDWMKTDSWRDPCRWCHWEAEGKQRSIRLRGKRFPGDQDCKLTE
jgi:hypothetical protein